MLDCSERAIGRGVKVVWLSERRRRHGVEVPSAATAVRRETGMDVGASHPQHGDVVQWWPPP